MEEIDKKQISEDEKEVFFKPIDGELSLKETTEVESYCVNCGENGMTKFLLTLIPFYKEVIISSFNCEACGFTNNEIQPAGEIPLRGVKFTLKVQNAGDLNRHVIKSDYAAISIPAIELEIPSKSQKGEVTTVEGILQRVITNLEVEQPVRKISAPDDYEKLQLFISKVKKCLEDKCFELKIRDISGNSFISPPSDILEGLKDPHLTREEFNRSTDENNQLGIFMQPMNEISEEEEETDLAAEVLEFPTDCPNCGASTTTKMKLTNIPHFKQVIIMATDCDACGARTNEVKSGAGVEPKGKRISLKVTTTDDGCRDVLKSETCSFEIPELELEMGAGTLGGKFTTLEGLLGDVKAQLGKENPFMAGDSAEDGLKGKMAQFLLKFDSLLGSGKPYTVVLDDPAGNSYLQNVYAPDEDPHLQVEVYERDFEQNEALGLNDINTENYEHDVKEAGT